MITRTEIIFACSRLREDDTGDIPEEWIDYMEKAALEKIESPDPADQQALEKEAEEMYKMYEGYTSAEKWVTIGLRKGYIEGRKKNITRIKELEDQLRKTEEISRIATEGLRKASKRIDDLEEACKGYRQAYQLLLNDL